MEIKTGIDIIEVNRIKENIDKFGDKFLNRIYTKKEIEYCENKNVQKYQSYAGRFAGKEAIFKALSECIEDKFQIEWKDIEILNNDNGKPQVKLYGNLKNIELKQLEIDVSISHIADVAVASVVVKYEK
ncbi:MAG: holo-ACP synthase [Clostridia bacterium]|nr:holo-ACP synthase [Clostridia bacterium]